MRKWVHDQTWGAVHTEGKSTDPMGGGFLSPPQVLRAVKGLGKRGAMADEVRGTISMLAYEEGWVVGWWKKEVGQEKGDWLTNGMASLQARSRQGDG